MGIGKLSVPTIFFMPQIGYICIMKRIVIIIMILTLGLSTFAQELAQPLSLRSEWTPTWTAEDDKNGVAVDIAQYTPLVIPWAMKAIGQPTRSGWGRMATSQAFGVVAMAGCVEGLKRVVGETRPDATNNRSFPSGHTAWSFLGATMIERELGWRSPWYTFGGYTFASAVAMQRVVDCRHFPVDVAGGAVIGVVTGHLGYFIGDKIFGNKQLENKYTMLSVDDENQSFLSLETGMSFNLSTLSNGDYKISREPSLNIGVKYGMPIGVHWGASAGVVMRSTPIFFESQTCERTYVAPENAVGVELSPYYRTQLSRRFSLNADVSCGYYRNFSLKSIERAIVANDDFVTARVDVGSTYRLNDEMSVGATLGYEISNAEYSLMPNASYGITHSTNVDKTTHSLTLNISTKVLF